MTEDLFANSSPHTIVRKGDAETSHKAAHAVKSGKMREYVYELIKSSGERGTTIKEMVKANPEIQASSITSRPNELEKSALIHYRGDKRDGSRIMRIMKYKTGYRLCGGGLVKLKVFNYGCQVCK